jgi:hypothetical protein
LISILELWYFLDFYLAQNAARFVSEYITDRMLIAQRNSILRLSTLIFSEKRPKERIHLMIRLTVMHII